MAKANRQKWNFLVALTAQASEASDEDADEWAAFAAVVRSCFGELIELDDRVGKLEQWIAQFDTRMDELESLISEDSDEDTGLDDDGDEDSDVGGDESPLERQSGRMPDPVGPVGATGTNIRRRPR